MTTDQSITIPLSTSLNLSELLEIAQAVTDELEILILDAGSEVFLQPEDVSVEYK
jgi:hypothetical protein